MLGHISNSPDVGTLAFVLGVIIGFVVSYNVVRAILKR